MPFLRQAFIHKYVAPVKAFKGLDLKMQAIARDLLHHCNFSAKIYPREVNVIRAWNLTFRFSRLAQSRVFEEKHVLQT